MKTESDYGNQSADYNKNTISQQLIHEIHSSTINYPVILDAIKEGRARDIKDEKKLDGEPCFIIGSGPSLDAAIPHLKNWKGGIICTPSQATTLMHFNIEPSHILILDPFHYWADISEFDWSKTRTKLITQPGAWPDLIKNWPNEIILYRSNVGRPDSFYAEEQKMMYTIREGDRQAKFHVMIPTEITLFACSPPCQLFCAQVLGYGPIFLAGCDFGFHDGKLRYSDWKDGKINNHPFPTEFPDDWVEGFNKVITERKQLYYKKNFLSSMRLSLQNIVTTDHGLISELPYADIETVVRKKGRDIKGFNKKQLIESLEQYLAKVGTFVVTAVGKGMSWIESENPMVEIPDFIDNLNRQYICDKCGTQSTAPDQVDYTGRVCRKCGDKIRIVHPVDKEANMKRIAGLIEKAK